MILYNTSLLYAQNDNKISKDSIKIKKHNPKLASIMSAVIPGSGQIYNQQYWKAPLIYGGFGTLIFFIKYNDIEYQKWLKAYNLRIDDDSTTMDIYPMATNDQLKKLRDEWRRYRDLNYIGIVFLYLLNIVDASVDAHLFDYDIGDDLSLKVEPIVVDPKHLIVNRQNKYYPVGVKLSLKF
ncbi:MAG: hypothetical protein KAT68_14115 [Bacteroidales bacterium]|nr:hypothetical protein [Bacteroidales bacterium]